MNYWVKVILRTDRTWQWIVCTSPDWVNDQVRASNPEQRISSEADAKALGRQQANHYGNFKGFL